MNQNNLEKLNGLFTAPLKSGERILTYCSDTPEIMLKRGIISQETYNAAIKALEQYKELYKKD